MKVSKTSVYFHLLTCLLLILGIALSDESFFIVPSIAASGNEKLLKNNEELQAQVLALEKKLRLSEKMRNEQEEKLRERIEFARREVPVYFQCSDK
jgi:hypothetical protein